MNAAAPEPFSPTVRNIRRLIWLYIFLLVIEGALRKWIVPQLSNPLLLARDPVLLAIYFLTWRARLWPWNRFVISLLIIGALSWIVSIFVLDPYLPMSRILLITGYGFRSNFLHLPLIFIFPKVFDVGDVRKVGRWILLGMIPMGLIMALQFQASPDSFINRTVGLGEGEQITAGGGRIRPPATFSFISGPIYYLAFSTAFLLYGVLSRTVYRNWLLTISSFAMVLAIFVSGSRSLIVSVLLVVISLVLVLILQPSAISRFGRNFIVIAFVSLAVLLVVTRLPIVHEGMAILSDRFTESAEAAETTVAKGLFERVTGSFTEGLGVLNRIPALGYGLGIGTNVGARFIVGRAAFLLAENEWSRVLLESGPIFGVAFLLWRTVTVAYLGIVSLRSLLKGEILPLLLLSAGFLILLNGQLGQPTSLGFAVVVNGLCLAAARPKKSDEKVSAPAKEPSRKIRGRSLYAERLHRSSASPQNNGSVDR